MGYGIDPILYAIIKSDPNPLSDLHVNYIFKYADDTTVLVPRHTNVLYSISSR